ncbi:MAG TPA: hypothetical protein PK693_12125 [Halothiobacillus sp.]|nr:hypothetical protein [Halothiobacillus sp.]
MSNIKSSEKKFLVSRLVYPANHESGKIRRLNPEIPPSTDINNARFNVAGSLKGDGKDYEFVN